MFTKKYKLTQDQVDEMNALYAGLKQEIVDLKADRSRDFLLNKCKSLQDANEDLASKLEYANKQLKISNTTMSAVLEKLHETSTKYETTMLMLDCNLEPVTKNELDILA